MMTSDEIRAAIHRVGNALGRTTDEVVEALCDRPVNGCVLRSKLIELLRQADPDGHMELPVDADGVPIHIGNELCGYGYPNGGVRCYAIVNERTILVQGDPSAYKDWLLWDAANCRHYHAPTMKDVLRDFLSASEDAMRKGYDEVPDEIYAEYAKRLREVMSDE